MSKFKPGDVCVIVRASNYPRFVGRECTLLHRNAFRDEWALEFPDGAKPNQYGYWTAPDECLRLRRPPSWDEWLTKDSHLTDEDRLETARDASLEAYLAARAGGPP